MIIKQQSKFALTKYLLMSILAQRIPSDFQQIFDIIISLYFKLQSE